MKESKILAFTLVMSSLLIQCNRSEVVLPKINSVAGNSTSTPVATMVNPNSDCKKILVDSSHDGGGWWFPQGPPNFDANSPHQGRAFAQMLKDAGFSVDELSRGLTISDEILKGYGVIIRAGGFNPYTSDELTAYKNAVNKGITLVLITDHKKYVPSDKLEEMLGVQFRGLVYGTVSRFSDNPLVKELKSYDFSLAGSVITNCDANKNIEPIGWLSAKDHVDYNFNGIIEDNEPGGMPVMGILHHEHSRIFMIGDINTLEGMPEPFTNNLVNWISECNGTH